MSRLKAEIGLPFKAHAGTWSSGHGNDTKNPYYSVPAYKFKVEGGGAVPQGPGLWDHVFSKNRASFNLQAIKQDHMCEEINMRSMSSTVNVARDWLAGMGQGAENQNFSIQYLLGPMTLNTRMVFLLRLAEICRTIRVHSAQLD